MDNNQIEKSVDRIKSVLKSYGNPCLAWSGGKDSMALLDLVFNKVGVKMPIVFFREQWQPHKYEFQNDIIEKWGLEVYTWHPARSNMQQTGDEFEVQNQYIFNTTDMTCPTGIVEPEEGIPWTCALDIYQRPKNNGLIAPWDVMFVGHKACDSDPIYGGDAGTRIEHRINPNQCAASFPMRDWTHDDVFSYCESNNVPIQLDRYENIDGKWNEKADKSRNADYMHACTKCLDRRSSADKFVFCPKHKCTVENVADKVVWADQNTPSYMKD